MLESSFRWIHEFFKCVFSTILDPKMPRRRRVKKGKMTNENNIQKLIKIQPKINRHGRYFKLVLQTLG